VLADGDRIKQVFWNFAENAVRAMRNGGNLKVSIERLGDDWQVSFADTGTGMTPQQTEKLFEPFQSNFEGGTGLGLAVVYQIVQAHEGKVWARSKPGQGTTLVLRLRRLDAERLGAERQTARAVSVEDFASPELPEPSPAPLAAAAAEGRLRG
jgi:two-component system sensor histidine kinase PilS (NtrC family)